MKEKIGANEMQIGANAKRRIQQVKYVLTNSVYTIHYLLLPGLYQLDLSALFKLKLCYSSPCLMQYKDLHTFTSQNICFSFKSPFAYNFSPR